MIKNYSDFLNEDRQSLSYPIKILKDPYLKNPYKRYNDSFVEGNIVFVQYKPYR